jgi:hypothetical protein
MGLHDLPTKKASEALRAASLVLSERGHSKGAVRNPETGSVSATGALMLACGVPWESLCDDEEELLELIPQSNRPHALLAWECLEASVDDLYAWEDGISIKTTQVARLLTNCSDRLAIVTRKK